MDLNENKLVFTVQEIITASGGESCLTDVEFNTPGVMSSPEPFVNEAQMFSNTPHYAAPSLPPSEVRLATLVDANAINQSPEQLHSQNVFSSDSASYAEISQEAVTCSPVEPSQVKRKYWNKKNWKSTIESKKRMHGEAYTGSKKLVGDTGQKPIKIKISKAARKIKKTCTSANCRRSQLRSCQQFSENQRNSIFSYFWEKLTWKEKKLYVKALVDKMEPQQHRKSAETHRTFTYKYFLKLNGIKKQVCKQMFINTLGIGKNTVTKWTTDSSLSPKKKRTSSTSERFQLKTDAAKDFLLKLPKVPSHYCRSQTDYLYIEPPFKNQSEVYRKYKKRFQNKNRPFVGRKKFSEIMSSLKIKIYRPKKDACNLCCQFKHGNISKTEYDLHSLKKLDARLEKFIDKKQGLMNNAHVLCVDVQAVKFSPMLNVNAFYYKTKLAIHNFTIYNLATRQVMCYIWNECDGDVTANSFATCLLKYLNTKFMSDDKPIIIFSDGCTSQNRNVILANALLDYSVKYNKTITQKYLERGHTQMEVDSVHSNIELELKGRELYVPEDFKIVCENARKTGAPYEVTVMKYDDFLNFNKPSQFRYSTIRPGKMKSDQPHVTDLRQLQYCPNGLIRYKLNHKSDWKSMPHDPKTVSGISSERIYSKPLPISDRKYKDLQDLLPYIPASHHSFYKNLPVKHIN